VRVREIIWSEGGVLIFGKFANCCYTHSLCSGGSYSLSWTSLSEDNVLFAAVSNGLRHFWAQRKIHLGQKYKAFKSPELNKHILCYEPRHVVERWVTFREPSLFSSLGNWVTRNLPNSCPRDVGLGSRKSTSLGLFSHSCLSPHRWAQQQAPNTITGDCIYANGLPCWLKTSTWAY